MCDVRRRTAGFVYSAAINLPLFVLAVAGAPFVWDYQKWQGGHGMFWVGHVLVRPCLDC